MECRHRCVAPVEVQYKLVQIALEILRLNAVMRSVEPGLEVAKDSVDVRSNPMRAFRRADDPNVLCVADQGHIRIPENARTSHQFEVLSPRRYCASGCA